MDQITRQAPQPLCKALFDRQHDAAQAAPSPDRAQRADRLDRLERALLEAEETLVTAMNADFSYRAPTESRLLDITLSLRAIRHARRSLRRWMRPRRIAAPLHMLPARGRILPQPRGVVGIIAPWNLPVYLALAPLAVALAAGNRVMLKPSEHAPRTAEALAQMIAAHFPPEEIAVLTGGPALSEEVAALPFDHLLFTGSTAVGRRVAEAAARNLTPVTLELGGKSPAVILSSAQLAQAARRIAWGKTVNAGQLCVAPDYVLVPRPLLEDFVTLLEAALRRAYPEGSSSPDLSGIISARHRDRLRALLHEAETAGARVIRLPSDGVPTGQRKLPPALVIDPPASAALMQEEIFGPLLPVLPYDSEAEAIASVVARPRPLALYLFGRDRAEVARWLDGTRSGGVTVNDTVLHVAFDTLPFGGIGASGMGAYHGDAGFETFSHMRPVMTQSRLNAGALMAPPFTPRKARLLAHLRRLL